MNNWDKFKRIQCNLEKAILNQAVVNLTMKHYNHLRSILVQTKEDEDVFQDTFLKLTYKYNPDKDFVDQYCWFFNQLKGAYRRDDKANHFYQIDEERLVIPDFIKEEVAAVPKGNGTTLVEKLKAIL